MWDLRSPHAAFAHIDLQPARMAIGNRIEVYVGRRTVVKIGARSACAPEVAGPADSPVSLSAMTTLPSIQNDSAVANDSRTDLKSLLPDELRAFISDLGKERFRATQLLRWVHGGATSFDEMTDISKQFRTELAEIARIETLCEVARTSDDDGSATKLLFELSDGARVETVAMREEDRRTVCVSSQAGCALKCAFCATGTMGLTRNLTTGEMVDQVIQASKLFPNEEKPVTNIVFMGMGEPLQNYDNVARAVKILGLEMGLAISATKITISTAGLVPGIHRLAEELPKVGLAISLNATTDEVRDELMPINRRWHIAELLSAAKVMSAAAHRRWVTFEYVLIAGVNDSKDDARRLTSLLSDIRCKVNLIPFNPVEGLPFQRPSRSTIDAFHRYLWDRNFTVTVRWSKGDDIAAACGQLKAVQPA